MPPKNYLKKTSLTQQNYFLHNFCNGYENSKKVEKEELIFYFLNLIANFAAIAQENKVKPIGNTPLVSICGTCSMATVPELYIAATIGKATRPTTPSFVLLSETFSCMLYVLMFYQIV